MWQTYLQPANLDEALVLLARHAAGARIVAGGTDVLVELSRGVRPTATLIDVSRLRELKYVRVEGDTICLGALATHNDVLASPDCRRDARPLAQACWEVGAPQIRARATVSGNLVTASPANDTITPLVALDATLVLVSHAGERVVPLRDFYHGVRRTDLAPDELVREIRVPRLAENQRGLFIKLGLRRAQAISVVNVAYALTFDGPIMRDARIALGCVAPTIVRARDAEGYLRGKVLDDVTCVEAGRLAAAAVAPIDDVRGSAAYRHATLAALVADGLRRLFVVDENETARTGDNDRGLTDRPVLLEANVTDPANQSFEDIIAVTINGQAYRLAGAHRKSLLDALREDAGLTGTKEGCAEGECGACTVWLNGQAVMACLVPAPQAHGGVVTTIEGLAAPEGEQLHPLQEAFIAHGAVQCGYCIPGMLMAGAKLLQERARPDLDEVRVALSGNLCRCTGYGKILDAVLAASTAENAGVPVAPHETGTGEPRGERPVLPGKTGTGSMSVRSGGAHGGQSGGTR